MKAYAIVVGLLAFAALEVRAQTNAALEPDKVGYSLGFKVGSNWRANEMRDVLLESVLQGMRDALAGKAAKFSPEEMNAQLSLYQTELQLRVAEQRENQADRNKAASEKFLAENKTKPGVVALPSGLQYKVLQAGAGAKPTASDTIVVHYRGSLIDGTEFDNSYKRGTPAAVDLGMVMKGWVEALQLMSLGAKWQLFIPPDLAYGAGGFPQYKVGPYEALIFDAEVLDIHPMQTAPAPAQAVTSDIVKVPSAEDMKNGAPIEIIKASDVPAPK